MVFFILIWLSLNFWGRWQNIRINYRSWLFCNINILSSRFIYLLFLSIIIIILLRGRLCLFLRKLFRFPHFYCHLFIPCFLWFHSFFWQRIFVSKTKLRHRLIEKHGRRHHILHRWNSWTPWNLRHLHDLLKHLKELGVTSRRRNSRIIDYL
jgi:hypothetical protein